MPDKIEPKDLKKVLVRLTTEWEKLTDLLISLYKSQNRVIEVEKILLRDASGQYRGEISTDPDGSANIFLYDSTSNAGACLGVNQAGEAFLELKDQNGESSFKVASGVPFFGTETGPTATPAPQSLDAPGAAPPPIMIAGTEAEPQTKSTSIPWAAGPDQEAPPGWNANSGQKKLERENRRQKFYWGLILVVLGVVVATQAYMLFFRPYPPGLAVEALVVRDANGRIRATLGATSDKVRLDLWDPQGQCRATLGLGSEEAPSLAFYDRYQRLRAELNLGPDGEPHFNIRDEHNLQGKTEQNPLDDSRLKQLPAGAVFNYDVADLTSGPAQAVSPTPDLKHEAGFVGFKRSNKYHYPSCKYVKGAKPGWLIKFKSAADAQAHYYIPCSLCKPPPLSR